jgi:hypothetical protein
MFTTCLRRQVHVTGSTPTPRRWLGWRFIVPNCIMIVRNYGNKNEIRGWSEKFSA